MPFLIWARALKVEKDHNSGEYYLGDFVYHGPFKDRDGVETFIVASAQRPMVDHWEVYVETLIQAQKRVAGLVEAELLTNDECSDLCASLTSLTVDQVV